jgi:1,2-diacylglycerol 3-beta-glucosyltransferase
VAQLTWPFGGLPLPIEIYFGLVLAVIVSVFAWTMSLLIRSLRWGKRVNHPGDPEAFTWAFIVPALNEEVTIRDSIERLRALDLSGRILLVVDDGSDDRTPEILASIDEPDLAVVRRDPPNARTGKADALNHAYRQLDWIEGADRDRVIVAIVDADGRLHPGDPASVAAHFADPTIGGVQSLVRIYNRSHPLTWMQDLEFSVYGCLFQAGRNGVGTAGMGGNGQYNRLSALDAIADGTGPWRDRQTEDQDLGLRMLVAGSRCRQDLGSTVDQQGLSNLSALFRQRTRWSQGNLQAIGLAAGVVRASLQLPVRGEVLLHLLMPIWQALIGIALVISLLLAIFDGTAFWAGGPWEQLVVIYLLGFGGVIAGCISARAREGPRGWVTGFLLAHPYAFYTWLLLPVLVRATGRQLVERRDWAKTEREALTPT